MSACYKNAAIAATFTIVEELLALFSNPRSPAHFNNIQRTNSAAFQTCAPAKAGPASAPADERGDVCAFA